MLSDESVLLSKLQEIRFLYHGRHNADIEAYILQVKSIVQKKLKIYGLLEKKIQTYEYFY